MKRTNGARRWLVALVVSVAGLAGMSRDARAHCDTMSGPVIQAARQALREGNVNRVLIWVKGRDEAAIRQEFARARAARATGNAAQAERRFFEELVRIHRSGEGALYVGIKPAGTDVGPAVAAADRAIVAGRVDPVRSVLVGAVGEGIDRHFRDVAARQDFDPNDLAAGRAYVSAYVAYTHFAEGIYDRATARDAHHGHAAEAEEAGHDAHGSGGALAHSGHSSHVGHLSWLLVGFLGIVVLGQTGWLIRLRKKHPNRGHETWEEASKSGTRDLIGRNARKLADAKPANPNRGHET